jgi:hypothetical protein
MHASDRKSPFLPHWYPVDDHGNVENKPGVALGRVLAAPEPRQMPRQIGLPFTLEQYKRFQQWDDGTVVWDHPDNKPRPVALDDIRIGVDQIDALNRAHMGAMVGGSTMPGIEVGWKALEPASWGNAMTGGRRHGRSRSGRAEPQPAPHRSRGIEASHRVTPTGGRPAASS